MAETTFRLHKGMEGEHMNRTLDEELKASLVGGKLPCAMAFQIAGKLKVTRQQVGDMADKLEIRITDCQLGCFQVGKATHDDLDSIHIERVLAEEIEASQDNSHLPCAVAFKVATKLKVTPGEVGDAATKQKIKIINCQLGCFP